MAIKGVVFHQSKKKTTTKTTTTTKKTCRKKLCKKYMPAIRNHVNIQRKSTCAHVPSTSDKKTI